MLGLPGLSGELVRGACWEWRLRAAGRSQRREEQWAAVPRGEEGREPLLRGPQGEEEASGDLPATHSFLRLRRRQLSGFMLGLQGRLAARTQPSGEGARPCLRHPGVQHAWTQHQSRGRWTCASCSSGPENAPSGALGPAFRASPLSVSDRRHPANHLFTLRKTSGCFHPTQRRSGCEKQAQTGKRSPPHFRSELSYGPRRGERPEVAPTYRGPARR